MEGDRVGLERVGAALLDRPVAAGVEAELGDHDRLGRIAGADGVQERAERVAVVVAAAAGVEPAEVLVVADHVERRRRRVWQARPGQLLTAIPTGRVGSSLWASAAAPAM